MIKNNSYYTMPVLILKMRTEILHFLLHQAETNVTLHFIGENLGQNGVTQPTDM